MVCVVAASAIVAGTAAAASARGAAVGATAGGRSAGTVAATPAASDIVQAGCSWIKAYDFNSDPNRNNFAGPDTHAVYWYAIGPTYPRPDDRIRIDGRYPQARYFSIHAYNGIGVALAQGGALTDYQLAPDAGSTNPFLDPTRIDPQAGFGGSYSADVVYAAAPAPAPLPPNTLYRGYVRGGTTANTVLAYRVYLPADPAAPEGAYGLPRLTLVRKGQPDLPFAVQGDAAAPDAAACQAFWSGQSAVKAMRRPTTDNSNPPTFTVLPADGGLLLNRDNGYMFVDIWKQDGALVLVRGRAPTVPGGAGALSAAVPQLRYWSICEGEAISTKVAGCIADVDATLVGGNYHIVISDSRDRPATADAAHGFDWLPRATRDPAAWYQNPGKVALRNLLPAPESDFPEAIQYVTDAQSPATTMGAYDPQATYCSKSTFDAVIAANPGATPDDVFDACVAAAQ
jgi:hypothetical protein